MGTKDDKFLQDYEQIRKLIRMQFLYDDFTVDHAARIGLSVSRYNELKSTLAAYIRSKDANTESRRINNKKTFSLKNSMFVNGYNYLCDTFGAKNIVPSQFESYIKILQLLYTRRGEYVSLTDISAESGSASENSTLNNHINELSDMGYIDVRGNGYQKFVRLSQDCLGMVEKNEDMVMFLDMISLMRNVTQPYLCGNMMFRTAVSAFRNDGTVTDYENPFTFAQSHFEQVLDDEIVWKLMCAIHQRKKLSCRSRGDERKVCPLEIATNAETGRRYLLSADESGSLISMRMNQISYARITGEDFGAEQFRERLREARKYSFTGTVLLNGGEIPHTVELEFLPFMRETLERLFPDIEFTAEGSICSAKVLVNNEKEIKPWLRRNMDTVKVKDGTPLAEEIAEDMEQWRKVYGIV